MSNLLLIDKRTDGYETIINSLKPNVYYIGFDVTEIYEECEDKTSPVPMASSSFHYMLNKIKDLGISSFDNVGILQHNLNAPYHKFFGVLLAETSTVASVEIMDPSLNSWAGFEDFITSLKNVYSTQHIDLMACALYSNPNWKYVIDTLSQRVGIEIRASTDNTGNVNLGGNWFLESHTNVNLKTIYFTDGIDSFNGILIIGAENNSFSSFISSQIPTFTGTPSRPSRPTYSSIPSIPSFPSNLTIPTNGLSGRVVAWGSLTNGVPYADVSANLQSNVLYLYMIAGSGCAIKTDGSLVKWGRIRSETTTQFNTLVPNGSSLSSGVVSVIETADSSVALKSDGSVVGWGMFTGWPAFPSALSSGVVRVVSTLGDIGCLKSDGSVRGWGMNVFSSSSTPSPIYPSGANVNSGVVKLVGSNWPGSYAALKSDGSVVFFGNSGSPSMTNPTLFYPSGSNITSGVVDVLAGDSNFVALKSDGSVVVWGQNASTYESALTGLTATKLISAGSGTIIVLKSDRTYLRISNGYNLPSADGTETNIVDVLESGYSRLLFLRNDGTLAWRGNSFSYYFSVNISVHTDVVKIFNMNYPHNGFNQDGFVLKSNGELRTLNNTLVASNVNDVDANGSGTNIYVKTDGSIGVWGTPQYTGSDLSSNVIFARSNGAAFVLKTPVIIDPTITTFSVASTKVYGDASFAITTRPTSNSTGAITYSSSNTNVATIDASGNWITLVGTGDVSFNATQAAVAGQFNSAVKTSNTLSVSIGTPTLSGTTFAIPSTKSYGDASFNITTRPTSNSTGAITYSSSNTNVATIDASGNWITLVGTGDVSFNATQAAVANQFTSATKTSNPLTVFIGTPTLSTATFAVPSTKAYGDASFNITTRPTTNSSGAITYSSSNTNVATIDASGNWITLVGTGDVSFNATQAAVPNQFTSASRTSNPLTVSLGTPTLSGTTFSVATPKTYGDISFNITTRPTSNSSGAITYTSFNTNIATIDASGNWINIVGAGDVSFNATQAAVANQFTSATKTSNTLSIAKATPTLAFASPPTTKNVTNAAFTVTASSASLGAVTYASSNTAFATVNSTTGLVTLVGPGTVTITAAQAATAFYNAPANATCSIAISAAGSTLAGQTVASGTSFTGVNLAGASFANSTLSGVSFSGATLTGVNFSGAVIAGTNFTNANINGATNLPTFSTTQKLQLLSNINNVAISAIQITSQLSGADINAILPTPVAALANATFTLKTPTTVDASSNKIVTVYSTDISNNASIYIPLNTNESVKINGTVFSFNGVNILDASGNVRTYLTIAGVPFKIYAGSIIGLNILSTLNNITFTGDVTGIYNIISELFVSK